MVVVRQVDTAYGTRVDLLVMNSEGDLAVIELGRDRTAHRGAQVAGKLIRIFPNIDSAWRLLGALLSESHEEWSTVQRSYFDMAKYERWKRQAGHLDSTTERPTTMTQSAESEAMTAT